MQSTKFYKPAILSIPSLSLLAIVACVLLGLTEYATRVLVPVVLPSYSADAVKYGVIKMTDTDFETTVVDGTTYTVEYLLSAPDATETCPPGSTCAPPPPDWLTVGTVTLEAADITSSTSLLTFSPSTSDFLTPGTATISLPVAPTVNTATTTPTPTASLTSPTPPSPASSSDSGVEPASPTTPTGSDTQSASTTTTLPQPQAQPTATSASTQTVVIVFTTGDYFLGTFLPTLVAVLFAIPWVVLDVQAKRLEPFYQLSSPGGASAAKSLCLDYSGGFPGTTALTALWNQHWMVLASSLLTLCGSLLVSLAPEAVKVSLLGICGVTAAGCGAVVSVSPAVARVIEALLALMVSLVAGMMVLTRRRSTGVFAEPFSIAGQAALLHSPAVQDRIGGLTRNPKTTQRDILGTLGGGERYRLELYRDPNGLERYGIIAIGGFADVESKKGQPVNASSNTLASAPKGSSEGKSSYSSLAPAAFLTLFLCGLLVTVIIYYRNGEDTGFERFMDSQGFGVRFLFAFVGVVIGWIWRRLFRDIAKLRPYTNMAGSGAPASRSIILSNPAVPLLGSFSGLFRGDILFSAVSLCAFLAQLLPVTLVNIPFNRTTLLISWKVCVWISVGIVAIMLTTLIFVFFHKQPTLPVPPRSLATTLYYLSESDIPERFSQLAMLDSGTRNRQIMDMGLRYRFGEVIGHNGAVKVGFQVA